jgi:hypothetical protein
MMKEQQPVLAIPTIVSRVFSFEVEDARFLTSERIDQLQEILARCR